jgi:parvulin-like peptidyl-prolyl isomerase
MRKTVLTGLVFAFVIGTTDHSEIFGQAPSPATGRAPVPAALNEVLATITDNGQTDKITKGEVLTFVSKYPIPPTEDREAVYRDTIDSLINTKLLTAFLNRQKVPVTPERVNEEVDKLQKQLKSEGQDLASALLQNNISIDDVKREYETRIRWTEYLKAKATDATLRKFLADNRDLFGGTQVRASHILIKVEPNASAADREKIKQKLIGIKADIESNKMTFAAAANKYSEDPANAGGAGGDLDYFSLNTGIIEEFTNVAFKLKKGAISDPVETPFGFHLIQVTDRKEGKPVDFDQNKPQIFQAYAGDLQKNVVIAERKNAKIDIKPMPKDLFPAEAPSEKPAAIEKAATPAAPK